MPFVDRVAYRQETREQVIDIPAQSCITRDNIQVEVDGLVYLQVLDPERASYGIGDYGRASINLAQTTMRAEITRAEAEKEATVNVSEGEKQRRINEAKGRAPLPHHGARATLRT